MADPVLALKGSQWPRVAAAASYPILWWSQEGSDVVPVVEIGREQPVIVPLSPLLHGLPVPLFLLWGGKASHREDRKVSGLREPPSPERTESRVPMGIRKSQKHQ